jgi:uncharacterized protein RhaS with RHS repeats
VPSIVLAEHYNMYRTYDPTTGRYLEAGPIALAGGLNLYGYAVNSPTDFIDPTGLFCVYQQLTGRMTCYPWSPALPPECRETCDQPGTPRDGLPPYYDELGYSGTGDGRNNPEMQGVPNVGPIPQGPWMFTGSPYRSPNTGNNTMRLTPLSGTACGPPRDCDTFRIHGNDAENDASTGCVVLPLNRIRIPTNEVIFVQ